MGLSLATLAARDRRPRMTRSPPRTRPSSRSATRPAPQGHQWFNGGEVKAFEKGKVYIVEFWATWRGRCGHDAAHGRHPGELRPKGVTVIGFTAEDASNMPSASPSSWRSAAASSVIPSPTPTTATLTTPDMTASGQGGIPAHS